MLFAFIGLCHAHTKEMAEGLFALGLNAPCCPSLPLLTCARPLAGSPATSTVTQKMSGRDAFHRVRDLFPKKWDAVERVLT
jgi:hypothetical protein